MSEWKGRDFRGSNLVFGNFYLQSIVLNKLYRKDKNKKRPGMAQLKNSCLPDLSGIFYNIGPIPASFW